LGAASHRNPQPLKASPTPVLPTGRDTGESLWLQVACLIDNGQTGAWLTTQRIISVWKRLKRHLLNINGQNLSSFCARQITRMHGTNTKSLLIFTEAVLSDGEHMIQMIQKRGKSFLASIVLVLFVFGVVQMIINA